MELTDRKTADLFKALSDENRVKVLKLLRSGEKCACVLLDDLQISQPTLSHHMKILCDSGIVTGRKEGKWMHYSISSQGAQDIAAALTELTTVIGQDEGCCDK